MYLYMYMYMCVYIYDIYYIYLLQDDISFVFKPLSAFYKFPPCVYMCVCVCVCVYNILYITYAVQSCLVKISSFTGDIFQTDKNTNLVVH